MARGQETSVAPGQGQETDAQALEAGRTLFARPCRFVTGAVAMAGLPVTALPEIAFAGRSNVGKSSVINALTGHSALARTSNTPGRTQQINFFELEQRLMLVDLPGYGYAKAPKGVVKAWSGLAEDYLKGRPGLRRAALLIDARRGFMASDLAVMRALDVAAVSYLVILTKIDKLKPAPLARRLSECESALKAHIAAYPLILATSARSGQGIAELRAHLGALASDGAIH
ncbi:MAG: ribosome biogenesis GTP-binding protein YihA/YsxC [Alphaproteobacteria bacterium]|jgi:GTP-binding protein|nr:ribosome biogenesis GTP-binding protein YihA/YsxC [Alphaproteobacteria bacterium]MDP6588954.1 ribosome biogenesis GTP-binding protein YihA/YsxC [Alphaproteobacteria bacterium]MDP6819694.1 ribosome biogenesis GTP-binding protein YihA/YsxC [Alphaproteobacteria bacterium]|tara:strand:+ start:51 stop:737 length:687 start_codon:yes stop_codon:yes gene_type:complete